MEEALTVITELSTQAKEDACAPSVSNIDARAASNLRYYEGRRDALGDVLMEFEQHTVMASVKKRKAKEPA